MMGLVHKCLLNLILEEAGENALKEILQRAGIEPGKVFRMNEVYSDSEWRRLLSATCDVMELSQSQAEQAFAGAFLKEALERFPKWFEMAKNARGFIELQPTIHNTFAAGVNSDDARTGIVKKFRLTKENGVTVLHYASPNQLCGLYKCLAQHVLDHYGESATITEVCCVKDGADECEIHIDWST